MSEYLQKKYNYTSSGLSFSEKEELDQLRSELKRLRPSSSPQHSDNSSESSDDEKADQEFEQKLKKRQQRGNQKRTGVSAEAYGEFNKKEDFKARVIPKTEEQITKIKQRVLISFLFSNLDQKELDIVIGAMEEKTFDKDEYVIKQGEKENAYT